MEGTRRSKFSVLDMEEEEVTEGDHKGEEREESLLASQSSNGRKYYMSSGKGKRANVQTQKLAFDGTFQASREECAPRADKNGKKKIAARKVPTKKEDGLKGKEN